MKDKILKKAFDLMGKKTIKDVSMREIASACNVTKPTLYYYFKDKEELCYEIMKNIIEKQHRTLQQYLNSNNTLKEILFDIFEKTSKIQGQKSVSFFLHFVDYIRTNPLLKNRLLPFKQENDKSMEAIFLREAKNKTIDKDKVYLAYNLFQACVNHIFFIPKKMKKVSPIDMANAILVAIGYKENKI